MEYNKLKSIPIDQILFNIAEIQPYELTNNKKDELISELLCFYEGNKRHQYSDIANFIYFYGPDVCDYLISNLIELHAYCSDIEIQTKIFKIIDHIKLENIRLQYLEKNNKDQILKSVFTVDNILGKPFKRFKGEYEVFKSEYEDFYNEIEDIPEKVKKTETKLKNFNIESITILSIFSGIVMAFFGGLGFFNEILKNMHKINRYKLTFTTLVIGFILFNVFFFFMYTIGSFIDKPIKNECIDENCNKCNKKCNLFEKLKKLYPISFYMNGFFALTIPIVFMFWMIVKYKN